MFYLEQDRKSAFQKRKGRVDLAAFEELETENLCPHPSPFGSGVVVILRLWLAPCCAFCSFTCMHGWRSGGGVMGRGGKSVALRAGVRGTRKEKRVPGYLHTVGQIFISVRLPIPQINWNNFNDIRSYDLGCAYYWIPWISEKWMTHLCDRHRFNVGLWRSKPLPFLPYWISG